MSSATRTQREPAKPRRTSVWRFRVLQVLVSLAVPLVIVAFWCRYYVVLPSDDVFSVRVIRKQHLAFKDTVVFVSKFNEDYNRATDEEQEEIEKTYLYLRLLNTGIVRRTEDNS